MKRRDFIKVSSASGVAGMVGPEYLPLASGSVGEEDGFDLHPFIKEHPEAVFINRTRVKKITNDKTIYKAANKLAGEMFVKSSSEKGFSNSTKVTCKPNWTCNGGPEMDPEEKLGITTDIHFVEGFLKGVQTLGPQQFYLRECACPQNWEANGWTAMAKRNGFDFRDLTSKDYWNLSEDDLIFRDVPDGVVFNKVAFMAPMTAPDTFLINIAKFKAHMMGITGAVKNLQGITARKFHQYCGGVFDIFKSYDKRYHQFFHADYMEKIKSLHERHVAEGLPRWNAIPIGSSFGGGVFMEQWVQRMLDSYSVTPTGINMIEGVYSLDGNGFGSGPHKGRGKTYKSNQVIFGKDAFRVDIIAHWLAGHEPGNFGLFHIGIERGLSDVLNPSDIPLYLWEDGKAKKIKLDTLKRTPLLTNYLTLGDEVTHEDKYHLCDEPFDYSAWKGLGNVNPVERPSIRALGTNARDNVVMEVAVPEEGNVYMDILNKKGELVWRMEAPDLEPGKHEMVWDGFSQPGIYNVYVKGMNWDATREMVIYS
ncbi:MAG: DUF362 domain-containing protein [Saprospiraceae bacterium]|nr:DUF362 domain-containing protein [Saprospiraceae bacterium]